MREHGRKRAILCPGLGHVDDPLRPAFAVQFHDMIGEGAAQLLVTGAQRIVSVGQFQAFGAVPVNMELSETYDGLQRGTVDCVYLNYQTASLFKLFEVAKYTSDAEFGATPLYQTYVNKDSWESWSEEFRTLFDEVVADAEAKAEAEINAAEEGGLQTLLDNGVTLVPFEDQEKLEAEAPDFLEMWVEKVAEAGKPDAAREHADFIARRISEMAGE